jgi:pyruvate carboxylase
MAIQKSEFDKEMHHLEAEIRRLESEYNMFFAGRLKRPPFESKNRVVALVKKHDRSFIRNTADRFRFESLQNRFQKFLELVERQVINRELGRPGIGARRAEPKPEAPKTEERKAAKPKESAPKEKDKDKEAAVVRFSRTGDDKALDTRAKELYEKLAAAKQAAGEKPIAPERIQALVRQQIDKFRSEGKDVAFKVAMKDGKVTLTAKASEEKE